MVSMFFRVVKLELLLFLYNPQLRRCILCPEITKIYHESFVLSCLVAKLLTYLLDATFYDISSWSPVTWRRFDVPGRTIFATYSNELFWTISFSTKSSKSCSSSTSLASYSTFSSLVLFSIIYSLSSSSDKCSKISTSSASVKNFQAFFCFLFAFNL